MAAGVSGDASASSSAASGACSASASFSRSALLRAPPFGKPLANPVHGRREPVLIDRLHQIVDRLRVEGAERMFAERSDENEQRKLDVHQALDHREAVEPRHLDVEEDEVGLVRLDLPDRLAPVGGCGDDLDVFMRLQSQLQALGRKWLVIDQNGPDGHEAVSPVSKGISRITLKPPRSFCFVSNRCDAP